MSMFTKSIKMFHENHSVESYAKKWGHLLKSMSIRKAVMVLAHRIRKFAAEKHSCKASEISFAECLRMAWVEMKAAEKLSQIATNAKGFVTFQNRDLTNSGDHDTWLRLEGRYLTINVGNSVLTEGYADDLAAFCATHHVSMPAAGQRVTVAL